DPATRSRPTYNSTAPNSGGFNDPAFFYADKIANSTLTDSEGNPVLDARGNPIRGNDRTYGENWQGISQAVLVSENVDLLRWNRVGAATNRNEKDENDPFSPTTTFAPVAIPGDVAAPGFLTSGGVETPAAVPTLYQTKFAAWTYPYTIRVLRGSTNYNGSPRTPEPFGALTMTVDREPDGDIFIVNNVQRPFESAGTLTTATTNLYTVYSPVTRKLFVKTPRLTFSVDADRGRIETAFPPLMGESAGGVGVPYYLTPSNTAVAVPPGLVPAGGELITTRFKIDTRATDAGTGLVAVNQGIVRADLFAPNYQLSGASLIAPATMVSPLDVFGETQGAARARGVRIIVGSERLSAPLVSRGVETSWTRVGALGGVLQPNSTYDTVAVPPQFTIVPERRPVYAFNYDFYPGTAADNYAQIFEFDQAGAQASGMAAAGTNGVNFVTATYLWQNNYSRDPNAASASWGNPLSANNAPIANGATTRPEADIFRIDYATRQQYNINLGARIYDPTDGRAQTIQVSDKVIINNVLR
ncbi:MAG: hypothetical protein H7145_10600, partial [Akkermansiaceae bacterium]|nr:hypothetical protein [Armatimonadota bacterium]